MAQKLNYKIRSSLNIMCCGSCAMRSAELRVIHEKSDVKHLHYIKSLCIIHLKGKVVFCDYRWDSECNSYPWGSSGAACVPLLLKCRAPHYQELHRFDWHPPISAWPQPQGEESKNFKKTIHEKEVFECPAFSLVNEPSSGLSSSRSQHFSWVERLMCFSTSNTGK